MNNKEQSQEKAHAIKNEKLLILSIFASFLFHSAFLLPGLLGFVDDFDMEVDWLDTYSELQGLSTESSGRWAEIENFEPPVEAEEDEVLEPEKEIEKPPPKPKKTIIEPKKKPRVKLESEKKPVKKEKKKRSPKVSKKASGTPDAGKNTKIAYDTSGPSKLPNISGYGPGNVVYSAMIRTDKLRGTPLEKNVSELIQRIPDYRIALMNTHIDPVQGIDMLYVASARPQYISESFLAIKHRMSNKELQHKLDQRYKDAPAWGKLHHRPVRELVPPNDAYHDQRKIFLPQKGLALLGKTKWFNRLYAPSNFGQGATMMETLSKIQEASGREETIALVTGRRIRIPLPGVGMQVFETVKMEIFDVERPKLLIELGFKSAEKAANFAGNCGEMRARILRKLGFFSLSVRPFLDALTCEAKENYVVVKGTYTQEQVIHFLTLAKLGIPNPPVLNRLPPPPPQTSRKEIDEPKQLADVEKDMGLAEDASPPSLKKEVPSAPKKTEDTAEKSSDKKRKEAQIKKITKEPKASETQPAKKKEDPKEK